MTSEDSEEKGREGVDQFLMIGREVAWIWYWQGGGEGVKNPENLADVIYERPLSWIGVDI